MSKSAGVAVFLAVVSIAVMIYKAETAYQDMDTATKWAQAFGHGFAPWLLGLLVAGVKEGWARLRKREHSFRGSLLWATSVFMIIMVAAAALSPARATDDAQARDDAMLLMGASTWVPGIAAYCNKYVTTAPGLIDAAKAWNRRHDADMRKIVATIKAVGGLSKEEKSQIDRLAMRILKAEVESQPDKEGYCKQVEAAIDQGLLDLDRREDTAPAIRRIRDFQANQ